MLWAVIMAGGSGTRFWPESRVSKPKQFLPIFGDTPLLTQTLERLSGLVTPARVMVVTQKQYQKQVRELLPRIPHNQILGEPAGRNTAPCTVLAAALLYRKDPGAVLAILPSDHRIGNAARFQKRVQSAARLAFEKKMPVTFGMKPTYPHTGYGYLECEKEISKSGGAQVFLLKRFHEKPSLGKARNFLKKGNFYWNSGMFFWRADEMLKSAQKYLPKVHDLAQAIASAKNFQKTFDRLYLKMDGISIDYGLMEKMPGQILMLSADIDWHDLGGWLALQDVWPKDKDCNALKGRTLLMESSGNIVKASSARLVAMIGVRDMVVVDTPDVLLVCPKNQAEKVRHLVASLRKKNMTEYL